MSKPITSKSTTRVSHSSKIWCWVGGIGCVSLAAVAVLYWLQLPAEGLTQSPELPDSNVVLQPVGVMPPIAGEGSFVPLRYTATVVARRKSQLSFQASERVDELLVDEGDRVVAGQLLARQDDTALAAQHSAAVARMKQAAAVLAELKQGPRKETIEVARAELRRLRAQADLTQTTLRRQTRLQQTRAGAQQEYDAAVSDRDASIAAVESAQQRLEELETGTRKEKIDAQQAAFEITTAMVQQTEARLSQTRLFAPYAGRIARRFIDEGSLPQRGSPAFEIVEVDHLEIRFGVAADVAAQLRQGQALPFTYRGETFTGRIRRIQPTLDQVTRTQEVIVDADPKAASRPVESNQPVNENQLQGSARLVDGQTVQIEFAMPAEDFGMWLPSEALQRQVRGLWSVLVLDETPPVDVPPTVSNTAANQVFNKAATVARRDVELLATWGQWSRVRGTLEATDRVVVAGSNRVSVGQPVAVQAMEMNPPWQDRSVQLSDRSRR